jgi:hypothetical protein
MRAAASWCRKTGRVAGMIMLVGLLAGCDKCGDWFSPMRGDGQVCREQAPRPQ